MTISAAARLYGVDRRTIQRKINQGKLDRDRAGGVTVASLEREYRGAAPAATDAAPDHAASHAHVPAAPHAAGAAGEQAAELAALRAELAGVRETLQAKDSHIADLRRELDKAHALHQRLETVIARAQGNLLIEQRSNASRDTEPATIATVPDLTVQDAVETSPAGTPAARKGGPRRSRKPAPTPSPSAPPTNADTPRRGAPRWIKRLFGR